MGGRICNLCGEKIDYQYQIIFLINIVNHCWATIDMTFCLFAKLLYMEWECFDSAYIYEHIEIRNVMKKRSWSYFVYFKDINWFEIKDNIKMEDYKLKLFEW